MEKTGEITDIEWHFSKVDFLGKCYYPYRPNAVDTLVHRPKFNQNTKSYDLFFDERFEGMQVWEIARIMWIKDQKKKNKKQIV